MLTSYNGWTASPNAADFGGISPLVIAVHVVFERYFTDYHETIEDLGLGSAPDEWGEFFRQNRNANNISCHGSGTAGDANATIHPNGKRGTMEGPSKGNPGVTKAQATRTLTKGKYRGLIRWGGDFTGTADEMHHEIIGTPGQIANLAAELRGMPPATPANLPAATGSAAPWIMLPAVRSRPTEFQRWYNDYPFKPALLPMIKPLANNYGPQSDAALKKVQARYGLVADGIDGPLTKKVLWDLGFGKYVGM
jgi:hypothetical protein